VIYIKGFFKTDKGQVRKLNEDYGGIIFNKSNQYMAVIADGMGGHQAGEIASKLAYDHLHTMWSSQEKLKTANESEKWLLNAIIETNKRIYKYANQNEECNGMGTTIVVAIVTDEFITVGHVGDSRGYLLNETGFKQITEDHSLVNELIKSGEVNENDAFKHPQKHVLLKALGTEKEITPTIKTINWEKGNRLLLCSDGLSNKLSNEELAKTVKTINTEKAIKNQLIDLANTRGGEDNITIALIIKESSAEVGED